MKNNNNDSKFVRSAEADALLQAASARESWRVFGIMSEFVEATERPVLHPSGGDHLR